MKKYLLSLLILGLFLSSLTAQNEGSEKLIKHELGFDATSLIGRTIGFSDFGLWATTYEPTYYIYYRTHIGGMRLRAAIGGNHSSNDSEAKTELSELDYKIGAEFSSQLSEKFELYYGLDAVGGTSRNYREWEYAQEYLLVYEDNMDYVGIAPFLGIRFNITDRISVMSELSMIFRREQVKDNNFTKEVLVANPTVAEREDSFDEYSQTRVIYTAPDFIVLSFIL